MPLHTLIDSGQPISPPPDIQRTSLGFDVLSRFVCNTWEEATSEGARRFDAIVIGGGMFGGYCAEKIYRDGAARGLKVLVLDAGPFVLPTHVQNLPRIGLNVPNPLYPANDTGLAREALWGIPWRSNVEWVGQAYCIGGKSLYWGGWCPRLQTDDLAAWPATAATYLTANYPILEAQTGVAAKTEFIQGALFTLLKQKITANIGDAGIGNLVSVADPPLAVQGKSPASGLFAFDKYSSVTLLIDAAREAAQQADDQRRLFIVPNAHVSRLHTEGGSVRGIDVWVNGQFRSLALDPGTAVILALGTIESTRLALTSFPLSPNDASQERMGRNLSGHIRTNLYARIRRSAFDAGNILPSKVQTAAALVRGATAQGKFHLQITASADSNGNSDALLYAMIPDVDQLEMMLEQQDADWISIAIRGVSELKGDRLSSVPNPNGRWINLSAFERDEYGVPRAYVQMTTTPAEDALANDMDTAAMALALALAGNVSNNLQVVGQDRDGLGTTYHEAGTLWMGDDPMTSITNAEGRFHHISNAYCADQALFASVGSVNPTLTGLVLCRRVAEAVVDS